MKVGASQLPNLLRDSLAPVYLISGDEPLLVQECAQQIRTAAHSREFVDRLVFHADQHLDWASVGEELSALSLFAEKRRIEIHFSKGKLGDGQKVLENYFATPSDDIVLLLTAPRLDAAEIRKAWYKKFQDAGVHVTIWPVEVDRFPQWLQQRARSLGLSLTQGALELLSQRLEGNLLAAAQELDRLKLISASDTIDEKTIAAGVEDSARYSIFDLIENLLSGDIPHSCRIATVLEQENENPLGFLAMLTRELDTLAALQSAIAEGQQAATFFQKRHIRQKNRVQTLERAARRLSPAILDQAVFLCSSIDRAAKGYGGDTPWSLIRDLATLLRKR